MSLQLTVTNLLLLWVGALILAAVVSFSAWDLWHAGRHNKALIRAGLVMFLLAVGLEYVWWWMRWLLLLGNNSAASTWFFEHAHVTLTAGIIGGTGVAVCCGATLWQSIRWRGVALSISGLAAVWGIGLIS